MHNTLDFSAHCVLKERAHLPVIGALSLTMPWDIVTSWRFCRAVALVVGWTTV